MISNKVSCNKIAKRWELAINQKVNRYAFIRDSKTLQVTKVDNYSCEKNDFDKEFYSLRDRLMTLSSFNDEVCDEYRIIDNWNDTDCEKRH